MIKRGGRKSGGANDVRSLAARLQDQRRADGGWADAPEEDSEQAKALMPTSLIPATPVTPTAAPPCDDTTALIAAAKAQRAAGPTASPAAWHCLVVDDSLVVRKLTRRIAEGLGCKVTEAENGEEALARCRTAMPQIVITDWNMPVMSGIEFVTAVRRLPGSAEARVMFCTSNAGAKDIHQGIAAGADDYIVKPFSEEALKVKLKALIR